MITRQPSFEYVDQDHLFISVLAGSGVMSSISVATILQCLYPASLFWGIPIAGCVGLAFGWTVAYPVARVLARRVHDASGDVASAAAIALSLLLSLPACIFSPSIGLSGFNAVILFLGVMVGIGGLFFGGYFVDYTGEKSG